MHRIFTFFIFILPFFLAAQNNSGMVRYQDKMNLHKKMKNLSPEMLEMVPEFKSSSKVLLFSPDACLYRNPNKEEKDLEVAKQTENSNVKMVFRTPDNSLFRNMKESRTVQQQEFMGRTFLIEGELSKRKWKITGEQENIAGYMCMKALLDDTTNTVAWFTPQIPVSTGPSTYGDLPGLILRININEDERIIEAQKVDLQAIDTSSFVEPSEGKKVSREKYKKIVEEKTKEMMEMNEGSGTSIKIIKN